MRNSSTIGEVSTFKAQNVNNTEVTEHISLPNFESYKGMLGSEILLTEHKRWLIPYVAKKSNISTTLLLPFIRK